MALIPDSRKSQLTMLIWSLTAFAATVLLTARYAPIDLFVAIVVPFAWPLVIGPAIIMWLFLLRGWTPSFDGIGDFFEKYGAGLKQTWRGLAACFILFGTALNLFQLATRLL